MFACIHAPDLAAGLSLAETRIVHDFAVRSAPAVSQAQTSASGTMTQSQGSGTSPSV